VVLFKRIFCPEYDFKAQNEKFIPNFENFDDLYGRIFYERYKTFF
jgi:hypothetical protein